MLLVRNNSVLTNPITMPAASTIIPFDTIAVSTNDILELSENKILEKTPGVYNSECVINVSAESGSTNPTVTLTAYSDGNPITGASVSKTIAAGTSDVLVLPWATRVIFSNSGTASISWYLSGGGVSLTNAYALIFRHV